MGIMDINYTRLHIILFIFIFLTAMYTCQSFVLLGDETAQMNIPAGIDDLNVSVEEQTRLDTKTSTGGLIEMVQFITFTLPEVPTWMVLVLNPLADILLAILTYLIIDITYDIIKALPFT